MNKAANSYWVDERLRAQRVAGRTLPAVSSALDLPREIIGTRTEIRRRGGIIPSWVLFATIILATFALCVTAISSANGQMRAASDQYERVNTDVERLRSANAQLEMEVQRLRTDPRAIESAARTRLNMVRANEIIVPVE
ncbi:MAG TPA: septum formation initiator family protein [Pyrinomonadaceae bacterium]